VDPTNDQLANDRYVVTAFGRDYGDVPPLGGVIYTEGGTTSLTVAVDVVPV
jgi:transglutaminase-like putative cysteine protease